MYYLLYTMIGSVAMNNRTKMHGNNMMDEGIACECGGTARYSGAACGMECDECGGVVGAPFMRWTPLPKTRDDTFVVTAGQRSWEFALVPGASQSRKTWFVEDVRDGATYYLNVYTSVLRESRSGRRGRAPLEAWLIDTINGRDLWDWRHPLGRGA